MPVRALVIAIEDYPQAEGLARKLEGTHQGAEAFIAWLQEKKGMRPEHIRYCAGADRPGRTAGTTKMEIVREARAIADESRDTTEELYVFFSGHGFSFKDSPGRKPAEILVTSEFTALEESGGACIRLRELQEKLQMSLGPGEHYYFIDSCRNVISEEEIEPTRLGVKFTASVPGIGTLYTLYSTSPQTFAQVDSGFSQHLVDGLRGRGRAKGWVGSRMYVTFDLLRRYVSSRLPNQEADIRIEGSGEGQILELDPIPWSVCRVRVVNAGEQDTFTAYAKVDRGYQSFVHEAKQFTGAETQVELAPGDYVFEVRHPGTLVRQRSPGARGPVDAYEPCEVVFEKQPPPEWPLSFDTEPARPPAVVNIQGPAGTQLEVTARGEVSPRITIPEFLGSHHQTVRPGPYEVRLTRGGKLLDQRDIDVLAGMQLNLELGKADRLPRALRELELKSTMLPWERTPALMLSLLGAGQIVSPQELPERIQALPLQDFAEMAPEASLVYVLAFFEQGVQGIHVALGGGGTPDWRPMRAVAGVEGLWEGVLPAPAGPSLLSVQLTAADGRAPQPPLSYVTHLLPNRATLVTFSEDEELRVEMHQYLLPIHSLMDRLPRKVVYPLRHYSLRFVQALWEVQHEFAHKRTLLTSLEEQNLDFWETALFGKWIDPTMALFGAYELLRRREPGMRGRLLHTAIRNLRHYFGGIPDIELLAKLAGLRHEEPRHSPLILDGLLSWDYEEDALPLAAGKLTYEGPWVMWRNAVPAPVTEPPPTTALAVAY
ncbi:MAG TPA: caspase family protein [Archangium sp.]|nr:caspase family protein [Archangium sp.]